MYTFFNSKKNSRLRRDFQSTECVNCLFSVTIFHEIAPQAKILSLLSVFPSDSSQKVYIFKQQSVDKMYTFRVDEKMNVHCISVHVLVL